MLFNKITSFCLVAIVLVGGQQILAMKKVEQPIAGVIKKFPLVVFNNHSTDAYIVIYAQNRNVLHPGKDKLTVTNGQFIAKIEKPDGTVLKEFGLVELYNIQSITLTNKANGGYNIEVVPSAVQVMVRVQSTPKPVKIAFNNFTNDVAIIVNNGMNLGPQSMNTVIDNVVNVVVKKPNGEIIKSLQSPELINVKTINVIPGDDGSYSVEALP